RIGVKPTPWTYVCNIQRSGEDSFHRRRPRIISKPLNLNVRPETFLKPALALAGERVCDYSLRMSDVWKMTKSNRCLLLRMYKRCPKRKDSDNCCYFYFHSSFQ